MHTAPSKKDLIIFSLIWSVIFFLIGIYPLIRSIFDDSKSTFSFGDFRIWALIISFLFLMIAFFIPTLLTNFYTIWVKIGEFIGGIISRIVLVILFYGIFTPISIFLKILGKDLLNKKQNKMANTYWVDRMTQPGSLKKQY